MKIFDKIFTLAFVAVTIVGCTDEPMHSPEIEIPLDPNKQYIHFDTGVSTRGNLVTDEILKDNFAVLGYMYRGEWNTVKSMTKPNVFDSAPEIVSYNSAVYYSYGGESGPKAWTGNQYSFFGYYPTNCSNIQLFDGNGTKTGDPYIVYTMPLTSNPTALVDIMTAAYIDTSVNTSPTVVMNMRHRLACVDIAARNYYEYDHDNDPATAKIPVTIEITDLEVNLSNLMHEKATIYLDPSRPIVPGASTRADNTYKIVSKTAIWAPDTFDVKPNSSTDTEMRMITTQSGDNASSLILIPQEEELKGGSTLRYSKKYKNDNGDWVYINNIYTDEETGKEINAGKEFTAPLNINFNQSLKEGRRYYIQLTFTSDAVSINIVAADEWNETGRIDHEFE